MKTAVTSGHLLALLLVVACSASHESGQEISQVSPTPSLGADGLLAQGQSQPSAVEESVSEPSKTEQTKVLNGRLVTCGLKSFRQTLFLSASRHAWIFSEKFSGGNTIPALIAADMGSENIDSSTLVVVDFIRDHYKQDHFKLELDAEFLVMCDEDSLLGLQPTRVINSRLRRFQRE
jgi:hypothetical protein